MRTLFYFVIFLFLHLNSNAQTQSFEIDHALLTDTINKIDRFNQKQGNWVIYGRHYPNKAGNCFKPNQKIEQGLYVDNRKSGIWIEYHCNGKTRSKLTYVNGVLDGAASFYNTDGTLLKEGFFKANKWVKDQ